MQSRIFSACLSCTLNANINLLIQTTILILSLRLLLIDKHKSDFFFFFYVTKIFKLFFYKKCRVKQTIYNTEHLWIYILLKNSNYSNQIYNDQIYQNIHTLSIIWIAMSVKSMNCPWSHQDAKAEWKSPQLDIQNSGFLLLHNDLLATWRY